MRIFNKKRVVCGRALLVALLLPLCASAQFSINDTGRELILGDRGNPILQYRYGAGDRGDGAPAQAGFIEALWGPYGNVLTPEASTQAQVFTGIFWSWARVKADGEFFGPGEKRGATRVFERWLDVSTTEELATIGVQFAWIRDADGRAALMETQGIEVYPADSRDRAIDLYLRLTNVLDEAVSITGTQGGSPLGLTVQMANTEAVPTLVASPERPGAGGGPTVPEWIDLSYRVPRTPRSAGVTLIKHPYEPGGLQLRRASESESSLVAALPRGTSARLEPGQFVELRLRLYVHTGNAVEPLLESVAEAYAAELADSQP
jgi:hypothetical protein